MPTPDELRDIAQYLVQVAEPKQRDVAAAHAHKLTWAANEINRLNAIIAAASHKTFLSDSLSAQDGRVRARVWGILAWHVNRSHADLTDRDLALAAFREYERHWGCALIDPNE
jgi:hypothetical protein